MSGKYPKPAVSAAILNEKREILLTLRSEKVLMPGTWCLPGGHLEGGQDWIGAVHDEVREEVGLEVQAQELMGIYSGPETSHFIDTKTGVRHDFVSVCFLISKFTGEVTPNDEVSKFGWFSLANLPSPLLVTDTPKIQDAFKFQGAVFVK